MSASEVVITCKGRAVAVLLSPQDPAELEETLAVLDDALTVSDIGGPARLVSTAICCAGSRPCTRCEVGRRRDDLLIVRNAASCP